jgi:hypothetical protein
MAFDGDPEPTTKRLKALIPGIQRQVGPVLSDLIASEPLDCILSRK